MVHVSWITSLMVLKLVQLISALNCTVVKICGWRKKIRLLFHLQGQTDTMQRPVLPSSVNMWRELSHYTSYLTTLPATKKSLDKRHQRQTSGGPGGLWRCRELWGSSRQVPKGKKKHSNLLPSTHPQKARIKASKGQLNKFSSFFSCFIKNNIPKSLQIS